MMKNNLPSAQQTQALPGQRQPQNLPPGSSTFDINPAIEYDETKFAEKAASIKRRSGILTAAVSISVLTSILLLLSKIPSAVFADKPFLSGMAQVATILFGAAVMAGVSRAKSHNVSYAPFKRFFDIIISVCGITVLSPIMLVVAILVKLTSKGPIFFRQKRLGKNGEEFWCYKFRTMIVNAEELLQKDPQFLKSFKNDPRITPVGKFLRRTSLDELPEFFNVLRGDMSIVGPRPSLPSSVAAHYTPFQRRLLSVKPGLICPSKIARRDGLDFNRQLEMDMLYIDTMSFWNDLKFLLTLRLSKN